MVLHVTRLSLTGLIATVGFLCTAQAQQLEPTAYPANKVLARALDIETGRRAANPHEARVSSGIMYAVVAASVAPTERANASMGPAGAFDFTRRPSTKRTPNFLPTRPPT